MHVCGRLFEGKEEKSREKWRKEAFFATLKEQGGCELRLDRGRGRGKEGRNLREGGRERECV